MKLGVISIVMACLISIAYTYDFTVLPYNKLLSDAKVFNEVGARTLYINKMTLGIRLNMFFNKISLSLNLIYITTSIISFFVVLNGYLGHILCRFRYRK